MTTIFIKVLNMSITATYVALIVLIVRGLLKKSPRVFSYMLWSVVLLRLLFPINLSSPLSLLKPINNNSIPPNIDMMETPMINTNIEGIDRVINNSLPPATPDASVNSMQILTGVLSFIWVVGIVILLLYAIYSYTKAYRKMQFATLVQENIYETDQIITPFVLGFIKPKIYLPKGIQDNERDYIISHEKTHIRRFDYLIKPLSFMVLIIHWFNPIMWICYYLMVKDMEMSCDEYVLKKSNNDLRGIYSSSLLNLSIKQNKLLLPLAFGESNIKSRIKNILNYKKPKSWTIIISLIIVIVISIGLITNPIDKPAEKRAKEFLKLYHTIENTDIVDMIYDLSTVPPSENINNDGHGIIEIGGIEEVLIAKYGHLMTVEALDRAMANRTILIGEMAAREYGSKLIPEIISLSSVEESSTDKVKYQYDLAAHLTFSDDMEEWVRLQGSLMMKKIDGKWKVDDFNPDRKELNSVIQYGMPYLYITNNSNASIRNIEINTEVNTVGAAYGNGSNIGKNHKFSFDMPDIESLDFSVKLLDGDGKEILSRNFTGDFSKGNDMYLYIEEDELGKLMINRGDSKGSGANKDPFNRLIMVDGKIYEDTEFQVSVEIDESAILGKITSIVNAFETPTSNSEANFDIMNAKYAYFEEDIVVLIDNEWVLFKKQEDMISGITINNYGFLMTDLSDYEIYRVFHTIRKHIIVDKDYKDNMDSIIENSFRECGISDNSIIDAAKSNLKITVSNPK